MAMQGVKGSNNYTSPQVGNINHSYTAKKDKHKKDSLQELNESILNPTDSYEPGSAMGVDGSKINQLWDESNAATEALRKMIAKLLGNSDADKGQTYWASRSGNVKWIQLDIPDDVRAEAQSMISEDGFYGVKQTTDRLVNFAKALVGDNATPETIEKLRKATQKGFDEVARLFGGFDNLPDVTKQTYDATMKAFDEWLSSVQPEESEK